MIRNHTLTTQRGRWKQFGVLVLALISLGLLIWAGAAAWRTACGPDFTITDVTTCPVPGWALSPLLVALGFWAVGLAAYAADPSDEPVGFFLLIATVLAAGTLSALGSDPGARIFYLALAWLTPLTLHFHFALAGRIPGHRGRVALNGLAALAAILSLPPLVWRFATLRAFAWFGAWRAGTRFGVVLAILGAGLWLVQRYRRRASLADRRRIRLTAFGTLLAFAPLLALSLVPDTLGLPAYLPYTYTFPWLLLSPLAYGYARFRRRLVWLDETLCRLLTVYTLSVVAVGLYLVLMALLRPASTERWLLVSMFSVVGVVLLVRLLQPAVQQFVRWVFYGREGLAADVVAGLSADLARALDRETLRRLLLEDLAAAMQLTHVAVFLHEADEELVCLGATGFDAATLVARVPADGRLAGFLETTAGPIEHARLQQVLGEETNDAAVQTLLTRKDVVLWLPLLSDERLQGLVLVGTRPGDEVFTAESRRMLAQVASQAGLAAHNIRLLEEIHAKQEEVLQANRQALAAHQKRLHTVRYLHDETVQQMYAVILALKGSLRRIDTETERAQLQSTLTMATQVWEELRGYLQDLPSPLEELTLRDLLSQRAAEFRRLTGMPVHLKLEESVPALPVEARTHLAAIVRSALGNVYRHARAETLWMRLRRDEQTLVLEIEDDGIGFDPDTIGSVRAQMGLANMRERAEAVDGRLAIDSTPGQGTRVCVRVPLDGAGGQGSRGERETRGHGEGGDNEQ